MADTHISSDWKKVKIPQNMAKVYLHPSLGESSIHFYVEYCIADIQTADTHHSKICYSGNLRPDISKKNST